MRTNFDFALTKTPSIRSHSDFDRLFDMALSRPFAVFQELEDSKMVAREWFEPTFEFHELTEGYFLGVGLPGLSHEDIKIEVKEDELQLSGSRKRRYLASASQSDNSQNAECRFQRVIAIPKDVDRERIEATLENGLLSILMPKLEPEKPRTISLAPSKSGLLAKLIGRSKENAAVSESKLEK